MSCGFSRMCMSLSMSMSMLLSMPFAPQNAHFASAACHLRTCWPPSFHDAAKVARLLSESHNGLCLAMLSHEEGCKRPIMAVWLLSEVPKAASSSNSWQCLDRILMCLILFILASLEGLQHLWPRQCACAHGYAWFSSASPLALEW